MTVHLLSVGLSILDSLAEGDADGYCLVPAGITPLDVLRRPGRRPTEWVEAALAPPGPERDDAVRDRIVATAQKMGIGGWPTAASAELSGLPPASIDWKQDAVLLICSDDKKGEGLQAGLWNAVAMAPHNDIEKVALHADAGRPLAEIHGRVTLVRIAGMDVGTAAGFRAAMDLLGQLGYSLVNGGARRGEPITVHLSGGFKAAIPYLLALAEGLRSHRTAHPVEAVVLHEQTKGDPIRLPLRRMSPQLLANELEAFDTTGYCRGAPSTRQFEGWAYERAAGGWLLTPFGVGMRALFEIQAAK
jgi:hypothetical protein